MYLKTIQKDQIASVKESLHEYIPLTGTFVSGAYGTYPNDTNILKFSASHDLFESVYDYPYASSSANHIYDITIGFNEKTGSYDPNNSTMVKMSRIYKEMSQVLLGFDVTGSSRDFMLNDSTRSDVLYFMNMSRLLVKDGISLGSVSLSNISFSGSLTGRIIDQFVATSASLDQSNARVDSPAGQYSYLYFITGSDASPTPVISESNRAGYVFYQQGVIALDMNKVMLANVSPTASLTDFIDAQRTVTALSTTTFQNTIQIYSTIYNCNIGLNEFNYSSNPTYTSGSQIIVKQNDPTTPSTTYITTVGLYSPDGQLTAVAKLSEPLKKTAADSLNLRVRLDF